MLNCFNHSPDSDWGSFNDGISVYDISIILVEPIYRHFLKYPLSIPVKVRTDEISVIGYRLWLNIGSEYWLNFGDFTPDISVKHCYIGNF